MSFLTSPSTLSWHGGMAQSPAMGRRRGRPPRWGPAQTPSLHLLLLRHLLRAWRALPRAGARAAGSALAGGVTGTWRRLAFVQAPPLLPGAPSAGGTGLAGARSTGGTSSVAPGAPGGGPAAAEIAGKRRHCPCGDVSGSSCGTEIRNFHPQFLLSFSLSVTFLGAIWSSEWGGGEVSEEIGPGRRRRRNHASMTVLFPHTHPGFTLLYHFFVLS